MTLIERQQMLEYTLNSLYNLSGGQSDDYVRKHGNKQLLTSIQFVKIILNDTNNQLAEDIESSCGASLGLHNMD